MCVSN